MSGNWNPIPEIFCLCFIENTFSLKGSSSTTATTVTAMSADQSSPNNGQFVSKVNLKRPTTLALRNKSTPRNPKCNFLSSSKCLYHHQKKDWSERKRNIFVRLTSLRKDRSGVITSVALKATVTRNGSCDLEAGPKTATPSSDCRYHFWEFTLKIGPKLWFEAYFS